MSKEQDDFHRINFSRIKFDIGVPIIGYYLFVIGIFITSGLPHTFLQCLVWLVLFPGIGASCYLLGAVHDYHDVDV